MKVLIIGIESFTGVHLAEYLQDKGLEVFGTAFGHVASRSNIFQCDITNKASLATVFESLKPEYVINLAGLSYTNDANALPYYNIHVIAIQNILESILETKDYLPRKIVLAGSALVYGNQSSNILDETMIPKPVNHYGISKLAMEIFASGYFSKLPIIITRPFNYTGRGQERHFLIPKIVSHFKEKKSFIELGNINVYREFNDVEYVCDVYCKLLFSEIEGEILNIASNRVIALKEVVELMNNIAGYQIEIRINPEFVRANEIERLSGSTQKLYALIGAVEQKPFYKTLESMYYD